VAVPVALLCRGEVALESGERGRARRWLQRAFDRARLLGMPREAARARRALARLDNPPFLS
jgi:hypothetical protein